MSYFNVPGWRRAGLKAYKTGFRELEAGGFRYIEEVDGGRRTFSFFRNGDTTVIMETSKLTGSRRFFRSVETAAEAARLEGKKRVQGKETAGFVPLPSSQKTTEPGKGIPD